MKTIKNQPFMSVNRPVPCLVCDMIAFYNLIQYLVGAQPVRSCSSAHHLRIDKIVIQASHEWFVH